ncbi:hypothetical protein [Deinococcus ruber]|uniref:Uncharacterized protein n=1 Tax=Deinococcus ruber TaxID=1848197 RepID=A0A918C9L8_9DEIO|nr:hypothetical protein [Deinococcus ruber]GGR12724.1 hypothetical protein GCM10008957_27060 [Deinococcus ruber]
MTDRTALLLQLQDQAITLSTLEAPTGYGKTVVLNQLAAKDAHVLISLADADPDPLSIAGLFHQRLQTVFGPLAQSRLAYDLQKPSVTPAAIAAALRHDLLLYTARWTVPLTLLLDDAETLTNAGRLFLLSHLLSAADLLESFKVRWIISMRTERDLPVRSLYPRMSVQTITTRDLAFDECAMRTLGLTDAQCIRTAGWPAAVMLASLGTEPAEVAHALLLMVPEVLLPTLRRASLLNVWRSGDPAHAHMRLRDGWLTDARSAGIPCQQLHDGSFELHPIMREVLEAELRLRPEEYASAHGALADTLKDHQPMLAVSAYLEAGNEQQAHDVLTALLPSLQSGEQLTAALPLLLRVVTNEASPLFVTLAQALFDNGQLAEGLRRAEIALARAADRAPVLAVLGRMRLRAGNTDLAETYVSEALTGSLPKEEAMLLRAQLALALALQARAAQPHLTSQAELHAQQVIAAASKTRTFGEAELLARTALVITHALRGLRDHARHYAAGAWAALQTLSAGTTVVVCLTQLARFSADDGMDDTASALLEQARAMHGNARDADSSLSITLARAHLALRRGNAIQAATCATQAAHLAAAQHHVPAQREALLLSAITGVLPISNATAIRFGELLRHFGSDPAISAAEAVLTRVFVKGFPVTEKWRGDSALPLEIRALVAVSAVCAAPYDPLWLAEVMDLRQRLGSGAITAYAHLLGRGLPSRLLPSSVRIEVLALQRRPTYMLNGQPFAVRTPLMLPLLLLISNGTLTTREIDTLIGREYGESVRKAALSHLRTALKDACGWPDSVPMTRGELSLLTWSRHSDIDELDYCEFTQLERLYAAPVYASKCVDVPSALDALRRHAREKLHVRFQQWLRVDADAALDAWQRLQNVDAQLGTLSPVRVGVLGR